MPEVIVVLSVLLFIGAGAIAFHLFFERSRRMLDAWAMAHGFEILCADRRFLRRGPFLFTTGKGQDVYHVHVRVRDGLVRTGFVRCGSFWSGLLSDEVTVRWDRQSEGIAS